MLSSSLILQIEVRAPTVPTKTFLLESVTTLCDGPRNGRDEGLWQS
jgi:hypothetical protein